MILARSQIEEKKLKTRKFFGFKKRGRGKSLKGETREGAEREREREGREKRERERERLVGYVSSS